MLIFFLYLILSAPIKVSEPIPIRVGKYKLGFNGTWDKESKKFAFRGTERIKLQREEIPFAVVFVWDGDSVYRVSPLDTNYRYQYPFFWSPDGTMLICVREGIFGRYTTEDFVVLDIEKKTLVQTYNKRIGFGSDRDSVIYWKENKPHELDTGLVPTAMFWTGEINNQPKWYKKFLDEVLQKKRLDQVPPTPIKKPGRFFVKILGWDNTKENIKETLAELWAYPEGKEPYMVMGKDLFNIHVIFSPDSNFITIPGKDGNLYLVRIDGTDLTKVNKDVKDDSWYVGVWWAPDSKKFVYSVSSKEYPEKSGIYLVRILE